MFFFKRKQKKENAAAVTAFDETCFVDGSDEATEFIDGPSGAAPTVEARFTIKLTDVKNPGRTWTLPVFDVLLVGRAEHCAVQFYDQSVSREQFRIVVQGEGLGVVQIGRTNKTKRNGVPVDKSAPLRSGDILKFGRESLRVDYIQTLDPHPEPDWEMEREPVFHAAPDMDDDNTVSFF